MVKKHVSLGWAYYITKGSEYMHYTPYGYTNCRMEPYEWNVEENHNSTHGYRSYNNREEDKNCTIKVGGNGSVTAEPDQAIIYLGVLTEDKNVQNAQEENTAISNQVLNGLKKMGIKEEDIETTSYTIRPIYDYSNGKKNLRGYEVKHMFKITVKDISKVGLVIDVAVQNGANVIDKIEFTVSNPEFYYEEALEKALINARKKAEVIAKTMGVKMNKIPLRVVEKGRGIEPKYYDVPKLATNGMVPPIQEGEVKVTALVTALFQYGCFE